MKLQYKNNQWEDERGVPIAPKYQEKVKQWIFANKSIAGFYGTTTIENWQPEIGKLYDSGDLEFEEQFIILNPFDSFHTKVLALKENRTVTDKVQVEEKEIKNIEYLIWHGVARTCEEKCHCHAECNKADDFLVEFKSKFNIIKSNEIKQLQSRIAELEEQRERLIAKLMNAEDKI